MDNLKYMYITMNVDRYSIVSMDNKSMYRIAPHNLQITYVIAELSE
jgi:hypothetical protein